MLVGLIEWFANINIPVFSGLFRIHTGIHNSRSFSINVHCSSKNTFFHFINSPNATKWVIEKFYKIVISSECATHKPHTSTHQMKQYTKFKAFSTISEEKKNDRKNPKEHFHQFSFIFTF